MIILKHLRSLFWVTETVSANSPVGPSQVQLTGPSVISFVVSLSYSKYLLLGTPHPRCLGQIALALLFTNLAFRHVLICIW